MFKVSIIITTYKRPDLVVEAIQSCLCQTYPPFEIIIGDDSPDDVTKQSIEQLQLTSNIPIHYIHNQPSLKQARNVNMLFDAVEGDKTVLLHDDDLLLPGALEIMTQAFSENPAIDIAYGKQYVINESGHIEFDNSENFNHSYFRSTLYKGSVLTAYEAGLSQQIPNNGYMIKSAIIKKTKWRTDIGNGCEYEFGYRLGVEGYNMYYIDTYTSKYRVAANSMSGSRTDDAAYQTYLILKNAPNHTERSTKIKRQRLTERAPIAITQAIYTSSKKEAASILFSPWYGLRILSPRGFKRLLLLAGFIN